METAESSDNLNSPKKPSKLLLYAGFGALVLFSIVRSGSTDMNLSSNPNTINTAQTIAPANAQPSPTPTPSQVTPPSPTDDELSMRLESVTEIGSNLTTDLISIRADAWMRSAKAANPGRPQQWLHRQCTGLIDEFNALMTNQGVYDGSTANAEKVRYLAVEGTACLNAIRRIKKGLPSFVDVKGGGLSPKDFIDQARIALGQLAASEGFSNAK